LGKLLVRRCNRLLIRLILYVNNDVDTKRLSKVKKTLFKLIELYEEKEESGGER